MTENTPDAVRLALDFVRRLRANADRAEADKFTVANLSTMSVDGCRMLADWIDDAAEFLGASAMQAAMPAPAGVRLEKRPAAFLIEGHGWGTEVVLHEERAQAVCERVPGTEYHGLYRRSAIEDAGAREGAERPVAVMAATLQAVAEEGVFVPEGAEALGRFGHHPNPAIDFEIEVEEIEAEWSNLRLGFTNGTPTLDVLTERVAKAMGFRVGGDEGAVNAKTRLRKVEADLKQTPTPDLVEWLHAEAINAEADGHFSDAHRLREAAEKIVELGAELDQAVGVITDRNAEGIQAASRIVALEAEVARQRWLKKGYADSVIREVARATAAEAERDALRAENTVLKREFVSAQRALHANWRSHGDIQALAEKDLADLLSRAALSPAKGERRWVAISTSLRSVSRTVNMRP